MPLPAISIIERKQDVSSPCEYGRHPFFGETVCSPLWRPLFSFLLGRTRLRWMKCLTTLSIFINVATRGQATIVCLSLRMSVCLTEGPYAVLASLRAALRRPLCHIFLALSR